MALLDAQGNPIPEATGIDQAEYDRLVKENQEYQATLESLAPYAEDIKLIRDDPAMRELFQTSRKSYQDYQKSKEPKVPDGFEPMVEQVNKVASFVDKYEKHMSDEAERPQREYMAKYQEWQNSPVNNRFYMRLVADHPELKPRDIQYLAQVAAEGNFEPLESVWNKEGWRFTAQAGSKPPSSLRADAGDVGGTATPGGGGGGQETSMRDRIIQLERARRGMAS